MQKYVRAGAFPERALKARGPTPLDPYRDYIEERIIQGCRFPELIWRKSSSAAIGGQSRLRAELRDPPPLSVGQDPACPEAHDADAVGPARVFGWLI
ncbi:hypothetical protein ACTMU2_14960 [Cupriavidus basilensis]